MHRTVPITIAAEKRRQEFYKILGHLKLSHQPLKKWSLKCSDPKKIHFIYVSEASRVLSDRHLCKQKCRTNGIFYYKDEF